MKGIKVKAGVSIRLNDNVPSRAGAVELEDGTATRMDEKNRVIIKRRDGTKKAINLPR
ncbi:MAG: hypothetical protein M1286_04355 [Candidatus Marsarchaeota archaeon]|nr:hypothetical protein [Candidatus Marsarchaeota archaeon]